MKERHPCGRYSSSRKLCFTFRRKLISSYRHGNLKFENVAKLKYVRRTATNENYISGEKKTKLIRGVFCTSQCIILSRVGGGRLTIITGSRSDDWIYWYCYYNYIQLQPLITAHNRWLPQARSISFLVSLPSHKFLRS
jgi:hypothetical protein